MTRIERDHEITNTIGKRCSGCREDFERTDTIHLIKGWLWHPHCYTSDQREQKEEQKEERGTR